MRRRLGKYAMYLALLLLGLGLLLYGTVVHPLYEPLRDPLVRMVTRMVSRSLHGSLEIGALRGSLFSAPVLHNVVLRDAQGAVLGQIDTIRLAYDLTALWRLRLQVHAVEIVRPHLAVLQEADGTLNLAKLVPASSPPPPDTEKGSGLPVAVYVDSLRIRDGQLTLGLPSLPGVRLVDDLQVELGVQMDQEGLRVHLQHGSARTSPAAVDLHTLRGALQQRAGVVQVDDFRLQTGDTLVTAHGVLPGGGQPATFVLQMQPLALAEIGRLLDNPLLRDLVSVNLQAEGPPAALSLRGHVRTPAAQIDLQSQLNTAATPLQYEAQLAVAHLDLATLVGRADWQSDLNLELTLRGAGIAPPEVQSALQIAVHPSHLGPVAIRPSRMQIEAAQQRFQVQHVDLDTSVARLTASGALDLVGTSDLHYGLTADLAQVRQLVGIQDLAGQIRLQGQARGTWPALQAEGTLQAQQVRAQGNQLKALELTYRGTHLGGQPQVMAQLQAQQAQAGTLPIEQVTFEATYEEAARQARFALEVKQTAHTGGKTRGTVSLGATEQQVVLEEVLVQLPERLWRSLAPFRVVSGPPGLQIGPLQLAHAEESITASGTVAGDQFQDVRLRVSQLDLSYLQRLMHLPELLGGVATANIQLTGTLAEPHLQSEFSLRATPQQVVPFEQVHSTVTYAQKHLQGNLSLQQSRREVLSLELHLPVDMAFTSLPVGRRLLDAPVDIRLTLAQPDLAALQRTRRALPKLTGTLQGAASLRGTYAALKLETDLQAQQLGVEGVVERLQGAVRLTGALDTASSVAALVQALERGQVYPQVPHLALRLPRLQGQLVSQGAPPQPFQIQDMDVQATAQLTPAGIQATLQRLHLQTTGFGIPPSDVLLEAQATPHQLDVTRLQVRFPQSEVRLQGFLTLPEQRLQLRCDIPRLQLNTFPLGLPPDMPHVVQGVLTARGSLQAPQVEADMRYAGGQVRADLAAQLQEALPRYQATLRLTGLDMAQLLPKAQGRLQSTVRLQGTGLAVEQRRATLDMSLDTDGLNLAPGLQARVQANLTRDTLQVPLLSVRSTPIEVKASGTLSATQPTAFDYRLTLGDLRPLGQFLGMDMQAKGGLTGKVQGTRGVLHTQATLQLEAVRLAEWRIPRLQADLSAAQLLTTPRATLKAQVSDLQGPSLLPTSLRIDVARTPQQGDFTLAVTRGPYDKSTIVGTLFPTAESQRVRLQTVRLHHRTLAWENTAPVELVHYQQGGQVQLHRLAMRSGAQELHAEGTIVPDGAIKAQVQFRQIQIQPTVQAFAPGATVPDGSLNLNVVLRGTVPQPEIQGDLQLLALQWQQRALGEVRATFGMRGDTVQTELRWHEQERQLLHLAGTAGLGPQSPLNVRLQATALDLARLASLTPAVKQSAGELGLDLHLTGTREKPQLQGHLTLQDGALQLVATGEHYKDIQLRLLLERDRLEIAQGQIGSRTGPLQIHGSLQHTDLTLRALDLSVQAQQFTAMHTPGIEAVIGADIQVRGPQEALTLNGTVRVPRARIVLKNLPGGGPKVVQPWELTVPGVYGRNRPGGSAAGGAAAASAGTPDLLSLLQAHLKIDIPKNVWVQGPGTAVEMRGDLQVTKQRREPFIVSGTVDTVRGFASFYGKKFILTQGQVTFTGSPEINPLLDVTVNRKVSDYVVTIHAGGKAQQPEIALSSVPPLDQADIVSLLVIGKTTDKLTSSEQGSVSKQAQQLAGGVVASQLEGVAGEALGLDTIELTTDSAKVGRYVTQDLFLSYERGLAGKDNGNTVGAEYSLSRRLKLKGSSSDQGETALDLFWRLDY